MSYEDKSGLNVSNHYGARGTGGTGGVTKTEGVYNEFLQELDTPGLDLGFPVLDGSAYIISADTSLAGGTVTAVTIGGIDVSAATPEAPIKITNANTGVIVLTGGNGTGKYLIEYKKYPL